MNKTVTFALISVVAFLSSATNVAYAQSIDCNPATETQYAPTSGRVYALQDQFSRYAEQYVFWDNVDRLEFYRRPYVPGANFSAGTHENDLIFFNGDGMAYGNAPSGYWASELPSPYVDTQAFDSNSEKAVTIGSADAIPLSTH